jgi:hypothetical protein
VVTSFATASWFLVEESWLCNGYAMAMQWLCNGYAMAMKKPGDKALSALSPGHYHQAKGW